MQHSVLKIGSIPITTKLLLYTLLTIGVISGAITSVLGAVVDNSSFIEIFMWGLFPPLMAIGFIDLVTRLRKHYGQELLQESLYTKQPPSSHTPPFYSLV